MARKAVPVSSRQSLPPRGLRPARSLLAHSPFLWLGLHLRQALIARLLDVSQAHKDGGLVLPSLLALLPLPLQVSVGSTALVSQLGNVPSSGRCASYGSEAGSGGAGSVGGVEGSSFLGAFSSTLGIS